MVYLRVMTILLFFTLISCTQNHREKTVDLIIRNISAHNNHMVVVKGSLYMTQSLDKLLFASEKGGAYLDLLLDADTLLLDSYNINTHYCVIVKGHFTQYLNGMGVMGNLSLHGRIEVTSIQLC
jgi:outer membrane lipoprotein-sorting protein